MLAMEFFRRAMRTAAIVAVAGRIWSFNEIDFDPYEQRGCALNCPKTTIELEYV